MQETLSQLSDLNNDAIAESSRTAQKLTEEDWVAVENKSSGEAIDTIHET
jgi:golgin subfamily A member 4